MDSESIDALEKVSIVEMYYMIIPPSQSSAGYVIINIPAVIKDEEWFRHRPLPFRDLINGPSILTVRFTEAGIPVEVNGSAADLGN